MFVLNFYKKRFDIIVDKVNELNPDVIIITDDLTNKEMVKEYKQCKSLLNKLDTRKNYHSKW